jgi:DNA-binding CsgD family transcriptional regulator
MARLNPLHTEDVARRAFDLVAATPAIGSLRELDRVVGDELRSFGFELILGVQVLKRPTEQDVQILFGDPGHAWVRHYYERGYAGQCPVARAASAHPTFWREIRRLPMSPEGARMFDELRGFRLHEGHIVAVDKGAGHVAAVSMCGERIDVDDPLLRAATHFLSIHFGLTGLRLTRRAVGLEGAPAVLSPRQLECLKWVRAGKSSSDIGEILNISARTVDEHIIETCRKLGVKTRAQAVAEAALQGLLQL